MDASEAKALRDMGRRALESSASAARSAVPQGMSRVRARVTKDNGDGTLDVDTGSSSHPEPLRGVRMTTGCRGVKVGDIVLVETMNHVSYVTGVVSNDNSSYAKKSDLIPQQGITGQGLQGSTTQYVEIARSVGNVESNSESGHLRIHGTIGGYSAQTRMVVDVYIPIRNIKSNGAGYIRSVTRVGADTCLGYCTMKAYVDSSNILHVYVVRPAGKYFYYYLVLEGNRFTVPNTLVGSTSGTFLWDLTGEREELLLQCYPVGAVYISYVSTSPASLFGGTWTPITGRFPYFNAGTGTGGSNKHTLLTSEMPAHSHESKVATWAGGFGGSGMAASNKAADYRAASDWGMYPAGGGGSHNNMPSYQSFYAWRRTA